MKQEYLSKQDGKLAEIFESIKNRIEKLKQDQWKREQCCRWRYILYSKYISLFVIVWVSNYINSWSLDILNTYDIHHNKTDPPPHLLSKHSLGENSY